jgi:hypothetical protein
MNPIGEILVRYMVRRTIIGLLIAAALGGVVMVVVMEVAKRSL